MTNSNSGWRPSTRARTASGPRAMRSSHGSMPPGSTATNVCAWKRWSSPNARTAAFCPAASPSNVKITSPPSDAPDASCRPPPAVVSPSRRRTTLAWSPPNAVPQVATAESTPDRCAAMTSV